MSLRVLLHAVGLTGFLVFFENAGVRKPQDISIAIFVEPDNRRRALGRHCGSRFCATEMILAYINIKRLTHGDDTIWFGLLIVIVLEMALISPPHGIQSLWSKTSHLRFHRNDLSWRLAHPVGHGCYHRHDRVSSWHCAGIAKHNVRLRLKNWNEVRSKRNPLICRRSRHTRDIRRPVGILQLQPAFLPFAASAYLNRWRTGNVRNFADVDLKDAHGCSNRDADIDFRNLEQTCSSIQVALRHRLYRLSLFNWPVNFQPWSIQSIRLFRKCILESI